MKYPEKFVKKVLYTVPRKNPDRKKIEKMLSEGDQFLGAMLTQMTEFKIKPQTIINLLKSGKEKYLLTEARRCIRYKILYAEWKRMWFAFCEEGKQTN